MARTHARLPLATLIAFALLGCGPSEPQFDYGTAEMRQAVVGTWKGTLTVNARAPTAMTLTLDYAPPSATTTCGNRTLSLHTKCIDASYMNYVGTLTTADGVYVAKPVTAMLEIMGVTFTSGTLFVHVPDGLELTATIENGKSTSSGAVVGPVNKGTLTMTR
jgi:hypothetical protein